jgi:hypothetical protein
VTVTAVGFVPSAPLLVPAVAAGSAGLDEELRTACRQVVTELCAGAEAVVVAAAVSPGGVWDGDHTWGFEGFGVVRSPASARPRLPWPLGIGAWLLDDAAWSGARRYVGIDASLDDNGGPDTATAILAVGDGSARRTEKAPGHLDPRAERFDVEVERLIAAGDVAGLGAIDGDLAAELMCGGLTVWRWLSHVVGDRPVRHAEVLMHVAPYGVGYFVGSWSFRPGSL